MKFVSTVLFAFLSSWVIAYGQTSDSLQIKFEDAIENYQFDSAINYGCQWAELDSTNITAHYKLSRAYLQKGILQKAEESLKQALSLDSTHIPTMNQLARLYRKSDRYAEALSVYEQLMLTDSLNAYYPREAAELAYPQQQLNKAFHYYRICLYLDSMSIPCYLGLAKMHMDLKSYETADSLLAEGLKIDSSNVNVRLLTAQVHMRMESYDKVVEILQPLFDQVEPPLYAYRYYGIALYHVGDYLKSLEVMTELSNHDNELDYPHYYSRLSY